MPAASFEPTRYSYVESTPGALASRSASPIEWRVANAASAIVVNGFVPSVTRRYSTIDVAASFVVQLTATAVSLR